MPMYYPVSAIVWSRSSRLMTEGKIKYVYRRKDGSVGAEMMSLSRDDVFYCVGIEPDQSFTCGCLGNIGNATPCSHVVALVRWMEEREGIIYNIFDKRMRRNYRVAYMQTSLENLNGIMSQDKPFKIEGGLPSGIVVGLTADAETGKSILTLQLMYETMAKLGCNAFFLQTESGGGIESVYMEYWGQVFGQRFNLPDVQVVRVRFKERRRTKDDRSRVRFVFKPKKFDPERPTMFVANYTDSSDILEMLGRRIRLEIGGTGKITPVYNTDEFLSVGKTGFGRFLDEHSIGFFAIDSITEPINQFIGGLKNYPGRHEATNIWMKLIRDYASYYDMIAIGTHHETVLGFGQGKKQVKEIKGGKAIRHAFKFNILLESMTKTQGRPHGIKRIGVERHPFKPPLVDIRFLLLDDMGYHDIIGDPQYDKELQAELIEDGKMLAPKKYVKKDNDAISEDSETPNNWRDNA